MTKAVMLRQCVACTNSAFLSNASYKLYKDRIGQVLVQVPVEAASPEMWVFSVKNECSDLLI